MQDTDLIDKTSPKRKPRGRKIRRVEKAKKKDEKPTRAPLKIGYMRVSTEKQDHGLQRDALLAIGILEENIFQDTISGSKISREGRNACLKFLQPGDTLYVWRLDRFSRKLRDILEHLEMFVDKGIGFVSITQSLDTTSPTGRAMIQMIGIFAEFERETIRERVTAGIASKRQGRRWGRKPAVDYDEAEIIKLLKLNHSQREVAAMTGVSKATVQRVAGKLKVKKK